MIKNYMWNNLSGEIMGRHPQVRFCDLILNEAYMGIYVLIESLALEEEKPETKRFLYRIKLQVIFSGSASP